MRAYIPTVALDVLKIDTPQMIEVDRLMIEQYHIELIQMMENAGKARRWLCWRARAAMVAGPWWRPVGCTPGARRCRCT